MKHLIVILESYLENNMRKLKCVFLADPGHGWLKVNKKHIKKLNLADKISSYSYERNKHVYLEEDCDAGIFLRAVRDLGGDVIVKSKHTNKQSKIRSYKSFNKLAIL